MLRDFVRERKRHTGGDGIRASARHQLSSSQRPNRFLDFLEYTGLGCSHRPPRQSSSCGRVFIGVMEGRGTRTISKRLLFRVCSIHSTASTHAHTHRHTRFGTCVSGSERPWGTLPVLSLSLILAYGTPAREAPLSPTPYTRDLP